MFGRHKDAPRAAPATVFQMRQKMWSAGDEFWIENGAASARSRSTGRRCGSARRWSSRARTGASCTGSRRRCSPSATHTLEIDGATGRVATVHKKLISPLREHHDVKFAGGAESAVQGNIVDHEHEITSGDTKVAEVGKKWFRVRDTYGISVKAGQDPALVIAVAIVVDSMANPLT